MTICFFSAQYLPTVGGVERYTFNLARRVVAAGHTALVVTSALPGLPEEETDESSSGSSTTVIIIVVVVVVIAIIAVVAVLGKKKKA